MRIAIDTNCLIAALTRRSSRSAQVVDAWLSGRVEAVASEATVREAELVIGGGWLARLVSEERVAATLESLRVRTVWIREPESIPQLTLKDAGDRRMVETAVAGNARFIVTTDHEFLSHRGWESVEFVTPAEFLRHLA